MTADEAEWLLRMSLCPNCGQLAVKDFNTHPDTRRQAFWGRDRQTILCGNCKAPLIRNGAYGAPVQRAAWKMRHSCGCGRPEHAHNDVCSFIRQEVDQ